MDAWDVLAMPLSRCLALQNRYLSLVAEEAALASDIAQYQGEPRHQEGLWIPAAAMLRSGVHPDIVARAIQEHQQQGDSSLFSSIRRRIRGGRGGKKSDCIFVTADSELSHTLLKESCDAELRRDIYQLQRTATRDDEECERRLLHLLRFRQALARFRGYSSWTAYAQRDGILRTPAAVDSFLSRLLEALRPGVTQELETVSNFAMAQGLLKPPHGTSAIKFAEMRPWDLRFLMHQYHRRQTDSKRHLRQRTAVSLQQLLEGMQTLVERLLGLRLVRTTPAKGETWHWSVLRFELHEDPRTRAVRLCSSSPCSPSSLRGVFYLDLWSRPSKTRLLAQFTVRGSKNLSYADSQGWRLGGPLWLSSVEDLVNSAPEATPTGSGNPGRAVVSCREKRILRQVPCSALVCSFSPPGGVPHGCVMDDRGAGADLEKMLTDTLLPLCMSRSLLHEFGHVLHSLISETELQHLSGTRGAVDFAEFPSNLFEHFTRALVLSPSDLSDSAATVPSCNFAHLQALQLLLHALMDQAFYSFFPSSESSQLFNETGFQSPGKEAFSPTAARPALNVEEELQALRDWIDTAYSRHEWLVTAEESMTGVTVCDLVGKPQMTRFEHLVHYGGSYFCYLLCRVMSSFAWQHAFAVDPFSRATGERLHAILRRGSIDCSLHPVMGLAGPGVSADEKQHLVANPHLLPLEPFLEDLRTAEDSSAGLQLT
ncbi:peptidase family m3 protein [Cystoisospora suis]|uniref:Peptidase family m3 protein n=1 Tax=Cystoisospora suis TaxID=483139 RepID=A0A2C6L9X8_9APIC|nr:peptidase family m3 protein [Cystoisospora suis]